MNKRTLMGWGGILMMVLSVFLGLYMGLWVCFIGGIVMAVEGFKADPINSLQVGLGILRWLSSAVVGWLSFFLGITIGYGMLVIADN